MRFSNKFANFNEWLNNFKGSESYKNRIIRLHSKYPKASLSQLRGHPEKKENAVSELKPEAIYKRSWNELTIKEIKARSKSLKVLSNVRKGLSLSQASKELHIKPKTVIKNTNAFRKLYGKWYAKSQDHISRVMSIYENGEQQWIEIKDSRTASKISKYNSAVKEFLISGNENLLNQFKKPFKDASGTLHYFEIEPDKLYEIEENQYEEEEFYEIYKL